MQLRRLFVRLKHADACSPCISRASPQPEPSTTACKLAWQSLQGQNLIATVLQPAHAAARETRNNPTPSKPSQSVCINPLAIHYPRIAQHPTFLCARLSPTRVAQLNLAPPTPTHARQHHPNGASLLDLAPPTTTTHEPTTTTPRALSRVRAILAAAAPAPDRRHRRSRTRLVPALGAPPSRHPRRA